MSNINRAIYNIIFSIEKFIGLALFKLLFKLKVEGAENIPQKGPAVIAANHQSWLDPVLLFLASPRIVRYMAMEKLFRIPFLSLFMTLHGAFSVGPGRRCIGAVRESLKKLGEGKIIGIFPEGGITFNNYDLGERSKKVVGLKKGLVKIAVKGKSPVIPAGISGSGCVLPRDVFPRFRRFIQFTPIKVKFSNPLYLKEEDDMDCSANKIRREIEKLIN